jgi:hypothetical protein
MMEDTVGKAFLREVLPIDDSSPNEIRISVGRALAEYEKQARDGETNKRMKGKAAEVARSLCRRAVVEERARRTGAMAEHLAFVLNIMDGESGPAETESGSG